MPWSSRTGRLCHGTHTRPILVQKDERRAPTCEQDHLPEPWEGRVFCKGPDAPQSSGYLKAVWPDLFRFVFEVWPAPGAREGLRKCGGLRPPHFRRLSRAPRGRPDCKNVPNRNPARLPSDTQILIDLFNQNQTMDCQHSLYTLA